MNIIDKKIENCKIKLLKRPLTFFGLLSYGFEWHLEENLSENTEGFVSFNPNDLSTTIDKRIHINKKLLEKDDYTYKNLCFLIIHELQHIIRKHSLRGRRKENQNAWSLACEHCTDRDSKKIVATNSGDNTITGYLDEYAILEELNKALPNCSEEEAYAWILKNLNKIEFEDDAKFVKVTINPGKPNEQVIYITLPQIQQEDGSFTPINPIMINAEIEDAIENTIAEAIAISQSLQDKGSQPANISALIDKLIYVEVDWKIIVEKAIKKNVIRLPSSRSWRQLNKFYIPHKIALPGISSKKRNRGLSDLYILADSSGSISDRNLKEFAGIIYESMKYFDNTVLITHDTITQEPKYFTKKEKNKFLNFINTIGFKGRGGTSHKQCFQKIDDKYQNGENIGIVLALTDGYSDIEQCVTQFGWIKDRRIPLMIICNSPYKFNSPVLRNLENFSVIYIN